MPAKPVHASCAAVGSRKAPEGGAYYEPTLIAEAAQDSEIVQDEVFGPVLVALPFNTDDEALELANDTLRTGILGVDDERVPRTARHP